MISIACWNINSLRARLPLVQAFLEEQQPDIMLFQETKVQDESFPLDFFDTHYYNVAMYGQKSYNGVAIASKAPLEDVERCDFAGCEEARYIEAFTMGVKVACVYVPNGQSLDSPLYARKLRFLEELRAHIRPYLDGEEAFVMGGDFNVAPYDEDVMEVAEWSKSLLCSQPERDQIRAFLYEGWTDAVTTVPGQKNPPTWWDYRARSREREDGLRIDYFLLSPRAADRLVVSQVHAVYRDAEKTSDHAPIRIELNV